MVLGRVGVMDNRTIKLRTNDLEYPKSSLLDLLVGLGFSNESSYIKTNLGDPSFTLCFPVFLT